MWNIANANSILGTSASILPKICRQSPVQVWIEVDDSSEYKKIEDCFIPMPVSSTKLNKHSDSLEITALAQKKPQSETMSYVYVCVYIYI